MRTGQGEARARAKGIAVVGGCGGARGDGERFGVSKLATRVINFRTTPLRPDSPAHTKPELQTSRRRQLMRHVMRQLHSTS